MSSTILDKAAGALAGLALGDALGMPTQSMSPEEIVSCYGRIKQLTDAADSQPIAPGIKAGTVTDDTDQAFLIGRILVNGKGNIDPRELATQLLQWEAKMSSLGSLDLLGPSTKKALEEIKSGADPETTGKTGITNGAAMRVTPVGVATASKDPLKLLDRVYQSCKVTHDTQIGVQSAFLVAAVVSALIDDENVSIIRAVTGTLKLAESITFPGAWVPEASVIARTKEALSFVAGDPDEQKLLNYLQDYTGTSVAANEAIPAALALAVAYQGTPTGAVLAAANLGGDTDTIGAIAGAITGAKWGYSRLPQADIALVQDINNLDFYKMASELLKLRESQFS